MEIYQYWFHALQDHALREQELTRRIAERELVREALAARPSLRARLACRLARWLFTLAVATEREETWRVVWERLEARGRL